MKPPQNVAFLDRALRALSKTNEEGVQLRRVMSNVIVGQFMEAATFAAPHLLKIRRAQSKEILIQYGHLNLLCLCPSGYAHFSRSFYRYEVSENGEDI